MKNLCNTIIIFLILAGKGWANVPPDGVSIQQWQNIKQQIATSKYHPQVGSNGAYTAQNTAQGWRVDYAKDGMTTIKNNDYHIGMKLQSIGTLHLKDTPAIEVKGDTLYYQHSEQVKEWWVNSTDEVEQWFSIQKRPVTGNQELKVLIDIDTDTQVSQSGNQLIFTTQKGQNINYNKLKVWDSTGVILASRMQLADDNKSFALVVYDIQAIYPITIDPSFTQSGYIKPAVIDANDGFGISVAVDGDTMVVGAPYEDSSSTLINNNSNNNSAPESGAAYVFVRNGNNWVQQAYLKASNAEEGNYFGISVAISDDSIVIGALEDGDANSTDNTPNNNASGAGAAYVYTRNGTTWTQQAYLKASNAEEYDFFGYSVAISGDSILVGAYFEDGDANSTNNTPNNNASGSGAAYVFTRNGTTWTQQAYLKASNAEEDDRFGHSVAISDDSIVLGAYFEDGDASSTDNTPNNNATSAGTAYVFTRNGTTWTQQAYLKASNAEATDFFGYSVAISDDSIAVGAYLEDGDANSTVDTPNNNAFIAGAAYVFTRNGTAWTQQAYLKASNAEIGDSLGISVAISDDIIVIGAYGEDGDTISTDNNPNNNAGEAGAAYVFSRTGTTWTQQVYLKASNAGVDDYFGYSVAMSDDNIVVGALDEDGDASSTDIAPNNNAIDAGAVYTFTGKYSLGGMVAGLPFGSESVTLRRDGVELLTLVFNRRYSFPTFLDVGHNYSIDVTDAPAGMMCLLSHANGIIAIADVTNIDVTCGTDAYFIGGAVNGLTAAGLVLQKNGDDDLSISSNGSFVFPQPLFNGSNYAITTSSQPTNQSCTVINSTGTVVNTDVINVDINCTDNTYIIGVSVAGLTGTGLVLQNNGGDDLNINANGNWAFSTRLNNGNSYDVTILSQTNDPNNTCQMNAMNSGVVTGDHLLLPIICGNDLIFDDGFE